MGKPWTAVFVLAVVAITVAALVDAFRGGSQQARPASAWTRGTASPTASLPVCDQDQLALELEDLGGTSAVALRHVTGQPCQAVDLTLRLYVTSHGRRSEIPLGAEAALDGTLSPGSERSVPFSICRAGSEFMAEASAGPYRASGPVRPGGENCESAIREQTVDLGRRPGTKELRLTPLDPVTHATSFLIDLPRRADIRVTVQAGTGPFLQVIDSSMRDSCRHVGGRDSCMVDYGLLGEGARERWTVFVHKRSEGRAHVSLAISFIAARG